jgi:hypothetical protein
MQEGTFVCWQQGQNESQGRTLKAESPVAAAKKAMDIWRHEESRSGDHSAQGMVFVKDDHDQVHEVPLKH